MNCVNKILLTSYLFALPSLSQAYIGPGAGLTAIGSIIAFVAAILLMAVGFLWYPIKRFIKGKRDDSNQDEPLTESTTEKAASEKTAR